MMSPSGSSENKTLVIVIGNTDNKLSQQDWSAYVMEMDLLLRTNCLIHFAGGPDTASPYQNYTWVVEVNAGHQQEIMSWVSAEAIVIRKKFHQDFIFAMYGRGAML